MEKTILAARREMLRKALGLMEDALDLLDGADCSADVGAHLDLAICRLRDFAADALSGLDRSGIGEPAQSAK